MGRQETICSLIGQLDLWASTFEDGFTGGRTQLFACTSLILLVWLNLIQQVLNLFGLILSPYNPPLIQKVYLWATKSAFIFIWRVFCRWILFAKDSNTCRRPPTSPRPFWALTPSGRKEEHCEKYGCSADAWLPRAARGERSVAQDMLAVPNKSAEGQEPDHPPAATGEGQSSQRREMFGFNR